MPQGAGLIRHRLFCLSVSGGGWAPQVALELKVPASAGEVTDAGLIPGLGNPPGGGNGNPLQDSGLENPTDSGAWQATVHWVAKSWT